MERKSRDQAPAIVWALVLTFVFHVAFAFLSYWMLWLMNPGPDLDGLYKLAPAFVIGLSQLIYMIPAVYIARRRGAEGTAKGFVIGIALTILLNVACFGLAVTA